MKVHEIMTAHAQSVAPDNTLVEAAGLMRELDVGALPVMDGNEVAGIVTDRDIVVRAIADGRNPNETMVRDVMSGGTVSIMADQEVEEATRVMEQRQIRRLPVLDRSRKLVGMISLGDIATSSNPAFSGTALRDVSEPNRPSSRRSRLERQSETAQVPSVPGARRGPGGGTRRASSSRRATEPPRSRGAKQARGASTQGAKAGRRHKK